jgi:hypothetical protein
VTVAGTLDPAFRGLGRRHLLGPTRLQRLERLASLDEDCRITGSGLVATHDHIDVERIEFDPAADAASPVGGDESRTGTEERVKDHVVALGDVRRASSSMAVGLTVGWSLRPRRASEPSDEAPG